MDEVARAGGPCPPGEEAAIRHLRGVVAAGCPWYPALLEAMALWQRPQEFHGGRFYCYLIEGEALDWLVLAERLCGAVAGLLPEREVQELLLYGRPPVDITPAEFRRLIGPVRHHQYLNYFYGITVEEALFCAVRDEVRKERWAAGLSHDRDPSAEAYRRIYRRERDELLGTFRRERRYRQLKSTTLLEMKEFTYWLFRYRLKNSDPARVASDTRKGLDWLARQGRPMYPAPR